jgi:hypothetical protein
VVHSLIGCFAPANEPGPSEDSRLPSVRPIDLNRGRLIGHQGLIKKALVRDRAQV